MIDQKLVKYIETTVLQSAKQTRDDVWYAGRHDDGGASIKENNIDGKSIEPMYDIDGYNVE